MKPQVLGVHAKFRLVFCFIRQLQNVTGKLDINYKLRFVQDKGLSNTVCQIKAPFYACCLCVYAREFLHDRWLSRSTA